MQLGFAFIWLDLFCIPQDGSDRAEKEIANQSAIFKGSQNCIAWINDADSWDNLQGALDWLSLKFLKTTSRVDDDDIDGTTEGGRVDGVPGCRDRVAKISDVLHCHGTSGSASRMMRWLTRITGSG